MNVGTKRHRAAVSGGAILLAIAAIVGPAAPAVATPTVRITPVLSGLAAPRGIAFDGQGSMYVSESGVVGAGPVGMTHTGKVSKYARGHTSPAWSVGFNSLYVTEDPTAPPDVLGPAGISAVGNGCMKHSNGQRNGCQVQMITSESTPGILNATDGAVNDPQAGHLFRLDGATGTATDKADVGSQQYAFTEANKDLFPSDFPDSNPYAVLVTKGSRGIRTYVADAGANTISEVMRDGTTRIIAYIPNESGPPLRDATPTCIAQGPDGYLYVGTLNFVANLFVFGGDHSNVWRVNPNANYPAVPQLWASGLTTITACTFDRAGNFWATEMFQGGLTAQPPGDVVKIPFANRTRHTRIGFGRLPVPGGIAQGPDGAMYVTVGSSAPGAAGAVMRVAVS
jgi:glucose/arabinose dehydrogenase